MLGVSQLSASSKTCEPPLKSRPWRRLKSRVIPIGSNTFPMGMKAIIVAVKATTTMMVNHKRVRRDMRTP